MKRTGDSQKIRRFIFKDADEMVKADEIDGLRWLACEHQKMADAVTNKIIELIG
jgi:hypothetical protein